MSPSSSPGVLSEDGSAPWVRWALVAVWAFIAVATAVLALIWWQTRVVVEEFSAGGKARTVQAAEPELAREPSTTTVATPDAGDTAQVILAVGSDVRWGERGKGRSDTMLLVRVDQAAGTVSMLSLPRDLRVNIPGRGLDKLNAAYAYGGMPLLIKTVREYLGVRVDHFVQVDFGGFRSVVSQLGGVYLPIDGRYFNRNDGTAASNYADIDLEPGYQRLSSERALQFVRFRHADSDFHRAARQQLFLREVGRELQARTYDVTALPGLVETVAKATTSSLSTVQETLALARTLHGTPPDRVNRVVMRANGAMLGGVSYLIATPAQKRRALTQWSKPGRRIALQRQRAGAHRSKAKRRRATVELVPDGGAGRALARRLRGVRACAPSGLPAGYRWGADTPARSYELDGHDAGAMWATRGSGRSLLFMFTTWDRPPILERPSQVIRLAGHDAELFYESGRLRMVGWRDGDTRAWITNTLRNEVSERALIALARSCMRG